MDTYDPQAVQTVLLGFLVGLVLGAIIYQAIKDMF